MLPRIQRTEWEVVGSTELVGTELAAAPEFGPRRKQRCGARASEVRHCAASWSHHELGEMHGRDPFELRPRRRHGQRRPEFSRDGLWPRARKREGRERGSARRLTAEL